MARGGTQRRFRAAMALLAAPFLAAAYVSASESASASFRDTRWTLSQAGGAAGSASFRQDFAVGEIAVTTATSAGVRERSGLIAFYHHPAQPSALASSSGPLAGALYLEWTAPGNDGMAAGTRASAYQLRLTTAPGDAPALGEFRFNAAPAATAPAPQLQGARQSVLLTGLLAGTSYYLALRALEADGTAGPIVGATTHASIAQPTALAPSIFTQGISTIAVRWSSGAPSFGYNPAGSLYRAELSESPGFSPILRSTVTASLTTDMTGLDANTPYYARVAAFGTAVTTPDTVLGSSWTLAVPVESARVLCGGVAATKRKVGWAALPAAPQKASAFGYRLDASTAPDFSGALFSTSTTMLALSTLTLSGLTSGTTYYFRVATLNGIGGVNPLAPELGSALVVVEEFGAKTGFKQARLSWVQLSETAAACAPPGGFAYELYRSSASGAAFDSITVTTDSLHIDAGVLVGNTYYYRLEVSTESGFQVEVSSVVALFVRSAPPLSPAGIEVAAHESSATISWLPVHHFTNQVAFAQPAPPEDLRVYHVERATAPVGAAWTFVATVSSASTSVVDPTGGAGWYYRLHALNLTEASPTSMVRLASGAGYLPLPDNASYLLVPSPVMASLRGSAIDTESAYTLVASSRPEDVADNVISSIELTATTGRQLPAGISELPEMVILQAHFNESGGQVSPAAGAQAVRPTPENLSVYWHNGSKWVQMFGRIDALGDSVAIQTKYLGRYQLRVVERAAGVSFDNAGISNRMLTPNGDGDNDTVVFTFDNPRDSQIRGRIFDRRGRLVTDQLPRGPVANSLVWDGKANGRVVDSSVYIYMLEGEGKRFTGTVVVVR